MPEEGLQWLAKPDLLTDEEIIRLVRIAVTDLGVREVRFTGGEPMLRPGLVRIVQECARLEPRPELSLTTNGIGLGRTAAALKAAGLDRVNVSLDTLRPDVFKTLPRRARHKDVVEGLLAARAAAAAGVPFCLSSFSIASINRVAREAPGRNMLVMSSSDLRALGAEMLDAARQAGVERSVYTSSVAITGIRERDVRNGFRSLTSPPGLLARLARKPGWCLDMLRHGPQRVEALDAHPEFGGSVMAQAAALSSRIDQSLSWDDLAWVRENWPGKIVVKGLLCAEDARRAEDAGVSAIVISNHGGRQLDGASSTIARLPEITAAVPGMELLIDSGFRRGADIVKALALGASGVLLARAYAYGLAAGGEAGVSQIIAALRAEIEIALALMGCPNIPTLRAEGARYVRPV
jgi:isopentenyl diphosphate isomerase/L-lactate dehydrogenase-like FMN-dependent dehydrogenase